MSIRTLATKQLSNEINNPTVVLSGASLPAPGERMLVLGAFYFFTGATFFVEDDQSTAFTRVDTNAGQGSFVKAQQWLSAPYAGGATCTVKLNNGGAGAGHYYTWMILGLTGLLASSVDEPARGTNGGNTSGVDGSVVSATALAQAANHVIGVYSSAQGANGVSLANPAGYDSLLIEDNGAANQTGAVCHKQTGAVETPSLQWSYTDNGSSWTACVVPYKLTAAGAAAGLRNGANLASKIRGGLR